MGAYATRSRDHNQCSVGTRKRRHHPGNESWSWFWGRFALLRFCCLWCGRSCFLSIGRESTIVWIKAGVTITNVASVILRRITSSSKFRFCFPAFTRTQLYQTSSDFHRQAVIQMRRGDCPPFCTVFLVDNHDQDWRRRRCPCLLVWP